MLAEKAGGVGALAELLGTTPMTVWRWANEQSAIRGPTRIAIETVAKKLRTPSPLEDT